MRVFHPFNVLPEVLLVPLVMAFGVYGHRGFLWGPLSGAIGLFLGSWLGRRHPNASLHLSAAGLKAGRLTVPWSNFERLDRRPFVLGGDRLVLREPLESSRWLTPWPARSIWVSIYERPTEIRADIAWWAPHLLTEAEVSYT